jgi:hypothetical protein
VNGDLAGANVGVMNVSERVVRNDDRKSDSHRPNGEGPAKGPEWRESVIQRSCRRQKRCHGRGTGAVMATGSYEGSLPMEGIPGHRKRRLSRGGAEVDLGGPSVLGP